MKRIVKLSLAVMFSIAFVSASFAADLQSAQEKGDVAFYERIVKKIEALEQSAPQCKEDISQLREEFDSFYSAAAGGPVVRAAAPALRGEDMFSGCKGEKDEDLKDSLRAIISRDTSSVNYKQARKIMFTELDNVNGVVECVYTGRKLETSEIPDSSNMNCEHTWPQSKGAKGIAKSDLHHLYPADSHANGVRGSNPFGNVPGNGKWAEGGSKSSGSVFEVRPEQRGNTARSMFYFSVRYNMPIDDRQEKVLREWNKQDPVDAYERKRCDRIQNIQNNRNPFVDHPEFVDMISDF